MNEKSLANLSKAEFAERYVAILAPIEILTASFYRENPNSYDSDVLAVYECILKDMKAKLTNFPSPVHKLIGSSKELYENQVKTIADINKNAIFTIVEIQACFKLLQKSVNLWSREHGSRGYLNYIANFL